MRFEEPHLLGVVYSVVCETSASLHFAYIFCIYGSPGWACVSLLSDFSSDKINSLRMFSGLLFCFLGPSPFYSSVQLVGGFIVRCLLHKLRVSAHHSVSSLLPPRASVFILLTHKILRR